MQDIREGYGVPLERITSTVTDIGSNFVKAFKVCGIPASYTDGEEDGEARFEDISDAILSRHIRCAFHTLSLIARSDVKKAIAQNAGCDRLYTACVAKCTKYWNASHRPKSAEVIQEVIGFSLPTPCPTRWNSFHDALSGILKSRQHIPRLAEQLDLPTFREVEMEFIEEYHRQLQPIACALDRLQGSKDSYYGEFLPVIRALKSKLESLNSSISVGTCRPVAQALLNGVKTLFRSFTELKDDVFILAAVSHPFFKLRWATGGDKAAEKKKMTDLLLQAAAQQASAMQDKENQEDAAPTNDDFFNFEDAPPEESLGGSGSHLEILKYLEDSRTDIKMLHNFPSVKAIFIKYNTNLCSSAAVERLFSFGNLILRPNMRRLTDSLFEKLLLLKSTNGTPAK
ncbi:uncharacterized protein LOC135372092 isoform X2 [Ornithodoros turicata]